MLTSHDLSSLQALYLAGERLDPDTYEWSGQLLGIPVIDNWWQTETGWPDRSRPAGIELLPLRSGSPTVAMPGYAVVILDGDGEPVAPGTGGTSSSAPAPGNLTTLWGDDKRYFDGYLAAFPGYYTTGDGGYVEDDGYLYVMGRTDDVINVAGHRLSTGSMEAVVSAHPAVAECAVIGVHDALKGQIPRAFIVLKAGATTDHDQVAAEIVASVRSRSAR